jgi:hypothetical protein
MPTQKLQPSRALQVIKSDNANVPTPNLLASGTSTSIVTDQLIDTNANFIITNTNGVQYAVNVGDVVYLPNAGQAATIVQVVNATTLLLNVNLGLGINDYKIYQQGPQTGLGNQGAVLYVGNAGDITVTTSGNDIVVFANVQAGTFIPVNVIKVWSNGTNASSILALW